MEDEAREKTATQVVVLGLAGSLLITIIIVVWHFLSQTGTTTNF